MAVVINTNLSSMIVQKNLNAATTSLNDAIERMTTGYKINRAKDNAAGYSIALNMETKLSSLDIASDNVATGIDLLRVLEDNYALISTHAQRVRDLTEQAANGTYGAESLAAIKAEIESRLAEIDRISENAEYNGLKLMNGSSPFKTSGCKLQIGITSEEEESQILIEAALFAQADTNGIFGKAKGALAGDCISNAAATLQTLDVGIKKISEFATKIGAAQNRAESAQETITVQIENLTSSLSTLKDADVARESSSYIKAQILQQASATLLATANQAPSIALNLV